MCMKIMEIDTETGMGYFLVIPQALRLVPRVYHLLSSIDEIYFIAGTVLGIGDTKAT